jgi:hypothetical protein
MLESEEKKTLKLQEDLLSNMTSLVKNFTSSRSESLHEAGKKVQDAVSKGAKEMELFGKLHGRAVDDVLRHGHNVIQTVSDKAQEGHSAGENARSHVHLIGKTTHGLVTNMHKEFAGRVDGQLQEVRRQKEELRKGASTGAYLDIYIAIIHSLILFLIPGFERARQTKKARTALVEGMSAELQEGYRALQSGMTAAGHNTSKTLEELLDEVRFFWTCVICIDPVR